MRFSPTPFVLALWVLAPGSLGAAVSAPPPQVRIGEQHRAFLKSYCLECHNEQKQKGQVRLDDLSFQIDTTQSADRWQKVLNQINSGEMPPEDAKQPGRGAKTEFLAELSETMMLARKVIGDQGRKQIVRRLNKREYQNTIRDLLGVELDVSELPVDGGAGSFDTVGSGLSMSSDQFESYLALGRRALGEAMALQKALSAKRVKDHRELETHVNAQQQKQVQAHSDNAKKYADWTRAVDALAALPEHAAAAAEIRKRLSGRGDATPMFYKEWDRLQGTPGVKSFGFNDANSIDFFGRSSAGRYLPTLRNYYEQPHTDTGVYLGCHFVHNHVAHPIPNGWPPGEYVYRYRIAAAPDAPWHRRFVQFGIKGGGLDNFDLISTHEVTGTFEQPQILEVKVRVGTGINRVFSIREKRRIKRGTDNDLFEASFREVGRGPTPVLWVDWSEIEGPFPDASGGPQPVALASKTQDAEGAREVIQRVATRAFRGAALEAEFVERLVRLFEARMAAGDGFEEALKRPLSVVLASPAFLYVLEPNPGPQPRPLDGMELANRLSYFLWSAPPDAELFALAKSGDILKPEVAHAQVDRLIASERFNAFLGGFLHQWLGMERLDFFDFDRLRHRDFDDSMKVAARQEVYQTFAHVVRSGGSLRELLQSDYAVVNGLLAKHYGLAGVAGDAFRKVALPPGSPRGGLLGMAAIHAMGSNGAESSPVHRGVWVVKHLLHDPPPPAPPNVPQLTRLEGQLLTTRERLMAHQQEPQCANCHRRFDPIGFGLENFDAAGLWRTMDRYEKKGIGTKEWAIDPAGRFHRGPAFQNFFELRSLVAAKTETFTRGLTEALLEYALGRPVGFADEALVTGLVREAQQKNFGARQLFHAVTDRAEFRSK
ncbi:MAG: hypothetical protein RLZZ244_159 [Verrucomicrobiota bacterium]